MTQSLSYILQKVTIFSALDAHARASIASILEPMQFEPGQTVFQQGDTGDALFIVAEGAVTISVSGENDEEIEVAHLAAGDFVGEMAIFERAPRSATCRATEPTTLYRLHEDDFSALIDREPIPAIRVMRTMLSVIAGRLDNTSALLSDMVQWGEQARKRAFTDDLTGLYNRRYLDQTLGDHVSRSLAAGDPLCVVMMDLDNFTAINNEYGHEAGDQLIAEVAPSIRRTFRDGDILTRYGGDEFTLILPATTPEVAQDLCSRLGRDISRVDYLARLGGTITSVTSSQGIACCPIHATSAQELRERADHALYRAKENGRNRSEVAPTNE